MRPIVIVLAFALIGLQYKLWFGDGSVLHWSQIEKKLVVQERENNKLLARNRAVEADITELRTGAQSLEGQARYDFGMVKNGEVYYQFIN